MGNNYIFEGKFNDYSDCVGYCKVKNEKNGSTHFPEDIWKTRQKNLYDEVAKDSESRFESVTGYFPKNINLHILDIGGGSGWLFEKMSRISECSFSYTLVETEQSLKTFDFIHSLHRSKDNYKAVTLKDLEFQKYEQEELVIYLNSVLQYIENVPKFMEDILNCFPATTLIFDDFVNSTEEDFWTSQRYYGHLVPYHFMNLNRFISQIENFSYNLENIRDYAATFSEGWAYKVIDGEKFYNLDIPKTLIFKR